LVEYQELQQQQQQILDAIREELVRLNLAGKLPRKHEALLLLKKLNFSPHIINHQMAVMRKALKIAHSIHNKPVSMDLIRAGALLHDIGRYASHELLHTSLGGDILRRLGFPEELARIAETHSLGGFTKEEAVRLGLPARDYMPRTIEEKIQGITTRLIARMMQTNEVIPVATHMIMLMTAMERLAAYSTNIAEAIVFLVDGKLVKHRLLQVEPDDMSDDAEGVED